MKEIYQTTLSELKQRFGIEEWTTGLNSHEAAQRLQKNGPNAIEITPTPKWKIFLRQYNNIVIYILLAATILTVIIGHYTDAIVIAAVVVLNSLIGYFQETSAANALAKIKAMMAQHATVYRNGARQDVNAADLVTGDVVFLEAGDNVPADLRIVAADNLRIEESALTGETNSVIKTADALTDNKIPLADQTNMAFASTSVTSGSGMGIVVATAEQTEIGKISQEVAQIKPQKTPLTKEIDYVGKVVSYITIIASIIVFIVGFFLKIYSLPALALAVVAMLVGAIPEGLPAITSVILAFGINKMAKRYHTIIKSMPAVETLGSVDVIATDKTGTLTKNEMSTTELWVGDQHYKVSGNGYAPVGKITSAGQPAKLTSELKLFLEAGYQANDTILTENNGHWQINGEPTDGAFLTLYRKVLGVDYQSEYEPEDLLPFDSDYRYIARLTKNQQTGQQVIFIKGSPDKLFKMATKADPNFNLNKWQQRVQEWSKDGKRVIAVGYRELSDGESLNEVEHHHLYAGLHLLGLAALRDAPREEVITALQTMNNAGVAVKMITGDDPTTARAIGKELGLAPGEIHAITGTEWDRLPVDERPQVADQTQVFARTTPQNKLEIIEALQQKQKTTAMVGDGVNDAPALKKADIGVAMGIKGTDVAKDSADMILGDDNFATMAAVIKEGRRIYDNIKRSILFLLPTSFAEGLVVAFSLLTGQEVPLQPSQLLWINLISAITIQFAFVFEPAAKGIMDREPRPIHQRLMSRHDLIQMGYVAALMAVFALIGYDWFIRAGAETINATTMMVNTIVFSKIFYFFSIRTDSYGFNRLNSINPKAWSVIGLMVIFQLILTYVPFMQRIFHVEAISLIEWIAVLIFAALILILAELDKLILRIRNHR
ncbi:HAD-IC family P-type ATPase [uncultured Limosilactobacillus sp.]|uniref:HAD-IC family P-type ATPase n=1 Tax=uncultured Limosilactobacillus sp. TaxID=2837629 RepID=UPI0025E27ACA|nr:HAD-IC family P-type ATPase [uncultured Limosilactobacillus sp.]